MITLYQRFPKHITLASLFWTISFIVISLFSFSLSLYQSNLVTRQLQNSSAYISLPSTNMRVIHIANLIIRHFSFFTPVLATYLFIRDKKTTWQIGLLVSAIVHLKVAILAIIIYFSNLKFHYLSPMVQLSLNSYVISWFSLFFQNTFLAVSGIVLSKSRK